MFKINLFKNIFIGLILILLYGLATIGFYIYGIYKGITNSPPYILSKNLIKENKKLKEILGKDIKISSLIPSYKVKKFKNKTIAIFISNVESLKGKGIIEIHIKKLSKKVWKIEKAMLYKDKKYYNLLK